MDKSILRKEIRARKKACPQEQLAAESVRIMQKLSEHPDFHRAEIVMLYASLPDEVQTLEFIGEWRNRKRIILPTVVGDDIVPVELIAGSGMVEGDFHILEPENNPYMEQKRYVREGLIDYVLVRDDIPESIDDHYELIDSEDYGWYGYEFTYYLYKKVR